MNIALITDDYLPNTGGIANTNVNIRDGLLKLGEKVFVFNNTLDDPRANCYKILESNKTLKSLMKIDLSFYIFIIKLFFRILFSLKGLKFKDRFNLAFYYCFYPRNLVNRIYSTKNLFKYCKDKKINVILSGKAAHPLFYSFIISKILRIPMATIAHGDDFLIRYPFGLNTIIFKNIEKIIVTNRIMKNLLSKIHNVKNEKLKVIHLGVNTEQCNVPQTKEELRKKLKIPENVFIIITVSRFYPRKGFETVLKAINLIIKENPNINLKYYIIGSGEEQEKIQKLIEKLKLQKYVKMLGFIDDNLKNQYYKLSDVFVLVPEIKKDSIEGFGIVYIEANFFKLPTIGTASGGVRIAVEDGKTGFLIKPGDYHELKNKILQLYNNPELRKQLGESGYKRVLEQFTWDKNIIDYHNVLNELIKN
ncbi:MAG: glycosyltransferase family 4 protein [Promethearchaeota archaeon]